MSVTGSTAPFVFSSWGNSSMIRSASAAPCNSSSSVFYADGDGNDPHAYPVGLGADGYFMYGQYAEHAAAEPALDVCGGHSHAVNGSNAFDPNEYHYHAYTTKGSDGMYSFWQGPSNCWNLQRC